MPIGIQVVGHNWEDEKVLGVMQAIENQIRFKPRTPRISQLEGTDKVDVFERLN